MTNGKKEREFVRDMAKKVAELAHNPENAVRLKRWNDHNSRRKTDRPPVICHPGLGAWSEIFTGKDLVCSDTELRGYEDYFRRILFKWEIGDDTVIDPYLPVHKEMKLRGEHFWGLPVSIIYPDSKDENVSTRTAYRYEPPLKQESDIEKIIPPVYDYDEKETKRRLDGANDLLGDILPAKEFCYVPGPGAWFHGWATELRGVEQLLLDMMDRPEWVHRLMRTLMEGFLALMDRYDKSGVLTLNNTGTMACDDLPQKDFTGTVRLKDLWGRGESQEFQGVSPVQHEEFLLQYQKPVLEKFGITYYGCCEDLTNKIKLILSIPNLRRFVCSAWTDIGKLAQAVGRNYTIEWRQKATDVAFAPDVSPIREHLKDGLQKAKGCNVMIVLQELETVNNYPKRLSEWARTAKEVGGQI